VPGSIRSATSEGTNALLADGAFPACSTADILVALSLAGVRVSPPAGIETFRAGSNRRSPDPGEDRVLYEALSSDPASLDDLVRVTGLGLPTLCGGLERLAQAGLAHDIGGWWQRA
jgi:predicted Rossmann fold nucleotide-binding protein DprA/Smf involved in DNA uptake